MNRIPYILLLLLSLNSSAQQYSYQWEAVQTADPIDGPFIISDMDVSDTDEKVILSFFREGIVFDTQEEFIDEPIGLCLAKYNASDSLLWMKVIARKVEDVPANYLGSLIVETDVENNIYVKLSYSGEMWIGDSLYVSNALDESRSNFALLKFDSEGNPLAHFKLDGDCSKGINFKGFRMDAAQNSYLFGWFGNSSFDIDSCYCVFNEDSISVLGTNTFLIRLNSDFQIDWLNLLDGFSGRALGISQGRVYIEGTSHYAIPIDFGDYVLDFPDYYDHGGFIAQYDTSGVFQWARYFGVQGWDAYVYSNELHAVSDNEVVLVNSARWNSLGSNYLYFQNAPTLDGYNYGNDAFFVVSYDSLGYVNWHDLSAHPGYTSMKSATSDSLGNVYVAGHGSNGLIFAGDSVFPNGSDDVLVVAYDSLGARKWVRNAGGSGYDHATDIDIDSQGNLYVIGGTGSPTTFGEQTYNPQGLFGNLFFAKMSLQEEDTTTTEEPIGIVEAESSGIQLYPNPTNGLLHIQSEAPLVSLQLYDVLGQAVSDIYVLSENEQLNLQHLPKGVYVVKILTKAQGYYSQKLLIQ